VSKSTPAFCARNSCSSAAWRLTSSGEGPLARPPAASVFGDVPASPRAKAGRGAAVALRIFSGTTGGGGVALVSVGSFVGARGG
jgi:hypothetical protein